MSESRVRELMLPFGVALNSHALGQLQVYLRLLLYWNRKINLTAVRDPELCVTRHFGETLFIARYESLSGRLLDFGSGAGFPGLALKLAFPHIEATLLEPIAKKRAFLKEVTRCCEMDAVEVRAERADQFSFLPESFDMVTSRGVGHLEMLAAEAAPMLAKSGKVFFWTTLVQASAMKASAIRWSGRLPIPLSRDRVILCGTRE